MLTVLQQKYHNKIGDDIYEYKQFIGKAAAILAIAMSAFILFTSLTVPLVAMKQRAVILMLSLLSYLRLTLFQAKKIDPRYFVRSY